MANKKDAQQNEFENFDFDENGEVSRFVIDSKSQRILEELEVLINNPKPKFDTIAASQDFVATIGGSTDLNVDGSVTPVEYTVAPVGSDVLYLSGISIWLEDKGTWVKDAFGALPGLTNGVLFELGRDTTFTSLGNFQNNFDIASSFNGGQAISLKDISGEIAIIGTQPLEQKRYIRLDGSNNDSIRITVRDDLIGLDNFSLKAMMWKDE